MEVYCTSLFQKEFEKICKKKNYQDCYSEFVKYFLEQDFKSIPSGSMLYGPPEMALWKKRLPDSSGYRFYFFASIETECVYLAFVHPKTGPLGSPNVTEEFKKQMHRDVLAEIKGKGCIKVCINSKTGELEFK